MMSPAMSSRGDDEDETTVEQDVSGCLPQWSHICNWRGTYFHARINGGWQDIWLPAGSRVAIAASCPTNQYY